jgi:hypothetical protein
VRYKPAVKRKSAAVALAVVFISRIPCTRYRTYTFGAFIPSVDRFIIFFKIRCFGFATATHHVMVVATLPNVRYSTAKRTWF